MKIHGQKILYRIPRAVYHRIMFAEYCPHSGPPSPRFLTLADEDKRTRARVRARFPSHVIPRMKETRAHRLGESRSTRTLDSRTTG